MARLYKKIEVKAGHEGLPEGVLDKSRRRRAFRYKELDVGENRLYELISKITKRGGDSFMREGSASSNRESHNGMILNSRELREKALKGFFDFKDIGDESQDN